MSMLLESKADAAAAIASNNKVSDGWCVAGFAAALGVFLCVGVRNICVCVCGKYMYINMHRNVYSMNTYRDI